MQREDIQGEESTVQKTDTKLMQMIQQMFGLDDAALHSTTGKAYQEYLKNLYDYKKTPEYRHAVGELQEQLNTSPVMMTAGNKSFTLQEFDQLLNTSASVGDGGERSLEAFLRQNQAAGNAKVPLDFKRGAFYQVRDLLDAVEDSRKLRTQLSTIDNDTVLIEFNEKKITAADLKNAVEIQYSLDKQLSDSDKKLVYDLSSINRESKMKGSSDSVKFPKDNFKAADLDNMVRTLEKKDKFSGQFSDIQRGHKTTINRELAQYQAKPLEGILGVAVDEVSKKTREWANDPENKGKSLPPKILQKCITEGLMLVDKVHQNDINKLESDLRQRPDMSKDQKTVLTQLQKLEVKASTECVINLKNFNKSHQKEAIQNRKNLKDPEHAKSTPKPSEAAQKSSLIQRLMSSSKKAASPDSSVKKDKIEEPRSFGPGRK
jgi:hypothetical protein